jgi:DHA2 family multidrug resistance protein
MTCMVPINNIALGTLSPERMKNASGLFNLTRNLGGAVGLALINTVLNDRWDLHLSRLHEKVTWSRGVANETLQTMTGAYAQLGSDASLAGLRTVANIVRQQALVMSFGDVFLVMTFLFGSLALLTPFIQRPKGPAPADAH